MAAKVIFRKRNRIEKFQNNFFFLLKQQQQDLEQKENAIVYRHQHHGHRDVCLILGLYSYYCYYNLLDLFIAFFIHSFYLLFPVSE